MKKNLTFIPLGIAISSAIIYLFNVVKFRIISDSATLLQILSNLKIYLYISIGGFIFYILIKILLIVNSRKNNAEDEEDTNYDNDFYTNNESLDTIDNNQLEDVTNNMQNAYVPNYDYVPLYNHEKHIVNEDTNKQSNEFNTLYCKKCGNKIDSLDIYCKFCGAIQDNTKKTNYMFKKIINLLEIVILILVLYFLVNMLFDYREKMDNNFKSPLKINMTK